MGQHTAATAWAALGKLIQCCLHADAVTTKTATSSAPCSMATHVSLNLPLELEPFLAQFDHLFDCLTHHAMPSTVNKAPPPPNGSPHQQQCGPQTMAWHPQTTTKCHPQMPCGTSTHPDDDALPMYDDAHAGWRWWLPKWWRWPLVEGQCRQRWPPADEWRMRPPLMSGNECLPLCMSPLPVCPPSLSVPPPCLSPLLPSPVCPPPLSFSPPCLSPLPLCLPLFVSSLPCHSLCPPLCPPFL